MAAAAAPAAQAAGIVDIPYELVNDPCADLTRYIEQGFGPDGLGIVSVSHIPGFPTLRQQLLPLAQQFAALPADAKARYEHAASSYSVGWSHGREHLSPGVPDTRKGSFYANPLRDDHPDVDPATRALYPSYYTPNTWPDAELPALEHAFKQLGALMVDVGIKLMAHCTRYLGARHAAQQQQRQQQQQDEAPPDLAAMLRRSQCHKGRLLHYFPVQVEQQGEEGAAGDGVAPGPHPAKEAQQGSSSSSWCGWHQDHGMLTGLTSALYQDAAGRPVRCPDPAAGLYIRGRRGRLVHAAIPPGSCAFQLGQVASIQSGGLLRATPHCVRAAAPGLSAGVSRSTFAVFMQPDVREPLSAPAAGSSPLRQLLEQDSGEWRVGMSFGDFAEKTISMAYQQHPQQQQQQQAQVYVVHE